MDVPIQTADQIQTRSGHGQIVIAFQIDPPHTVFISDLEHIRIGVKMHPGQHIDITAPGIGIVFVIIIQKQGFGFRIPIFEILFDLRFSCRIDGSDQKFPAQLYDHIVRQTEGGRIKGLPVGGSHNIKGGMFLGKSVGNIFDPFPIKFRVIGSSDGIDSSPDRFTALFTLTAAAVVIDGQFHMMAFPENRVIGFFCHHFINIGNGDPGTGRIAPAGIPVCVVLPVRILCFGIEFGHPVFASPDHRQDLFGPGVIRRIFSGRISAFRNPVDPVKRVIA